MQRMIWLIAFAVVNSLACATFSDVPPPKGSFCSFYKPGMKSLCVDLESSNRLPPVPVGNMDKWITMPPSTWNSIQTTIDKLRNRVDNHVHLMSDEGPENFLEVMSLSTDIKQVQDHTKRLYKKTLLQRN